MRKNFLWLLFLAIIVVSAGWFSLKSGYGFYKYYYWEDRTSPQQITWSVKQHGSDRYTIEGNYLYQVEEKMFYGKAELPLRPFKNRVAAEKYIKELSKEKHNVWYSAFRPGNSSLWRELPIKDSVYTIILWGLFLYFLWLGYYIKSKTTSRKI